jgi:hypothetical protein
MTFKFVKKCFQLGLSLTRNTLGGKLCQLRPYKTTQIQETESDYKRRKQFCNWIFKAEYDSVLDPLLTSVTDEAWFHLSIWYSKQ